MTVFFTPADWYYRTRSDAANVYSSARGMIVPVADALYQTWLQGQENAVTVTETQAEIGAALAPYFLVKMPIDPGVLAGWTDARKLIAPVMVASAHADIQAGNITLSGSQYNIASAQRLSVGVFRFAFIKPLPNTSYAALITCKDQAELANPAPDAFTINVTKASNDTATDPKSIDFQVYSK